MCLVGRPKTKRPTKRTDKDEFKKMAMQKKGNGDKRTNPGPLSNPVVEARAKMEEKEKGGKRSTKLSKENVGNAKENRCPLRKESNQEKVVNRNLTRAAKSLALTKINRS